MPSKIYLSVPLMWEVLQFKFMADSQEIPSTGLLDASLTPTIAHEDANENSTLEIIVATSPEITINTADGGQEAPTLSYKPHMHSSVGGTRRGTRAATRSRRSRRIASRRGCTPTRRSLQTQTLSTWAITIRTSRWGRIGGGRRTTLTASCLITSERVLVLRVVNCVMYQKLCL